MKWTPRRAALCCLGIVLGSGGSFWPQAARNAQFVGSLACRPCHQQQYEGWKQTRMANVALERLAISGLPIDGNVL